MSLVQRMAQHALTEHPARSAIVLERVGDAEAVRLLEGAEAASAVAIIQRLAPHSGAAVLEGMRVDRAAGMLGTLPIDSITRALRRVNLEKQAQILEHLQPDRAEKVRAGLSYPEGSAGSLMDPDVLALPQELTAREALQRVRKVAELARYNVYVVGDDQRLVGALNLRELFLADGRSLLSDLMVRDPHQILATADRPAVLAHPGWKDVHALPVVDGTGAFLGAIRYRTLREIEEELLRGRGEDAEAGAAFGQVIAAGARGLLGALSGAALSERGRGDT